LAALLLTHLLGLNALAWKERSLIEEKTAAIRALFVQTFPEVKVVVDAPLQMEREVMALRQATGQAGGAGLVDALTHVARMAPGFQPLDAMELIGAEVRLKGPTLSADKTAAMLTQLSTQGWQARLQGERLVLEYKAAP
jgi:general secretion pathway protein L